MKYGQEAMDRCPPKFQYRPFIVYNFAWCHQCRFAQYKELEDLDAAIHYFRNSLDSQAGQSAVHLAIVNDLSDALYLRYAETKQMTDLNESISGCQEMLTRYPPAEGHPERLRSLSTLASALHDRFKVNCNEQDNIDAISYARERYQYILCGIPSMCLISFHSTVP